MQRGITFWRSSSGLEAGVLIGHSAEEDEAISSDWRQKRRLGEDAELDVVVPL
jgi:hypothetical protein